MDGEGAERGGNMGAALHSPGLALPRGSLAFEKVQKPPTGPLMVRGCRQLVPTHFYPNFKALRNVTSSQSPPRFSPRQSGSPPPVCVHCPGLLMNLNDGLGLPSLDSISEMVRTYVINMYILSWPRDPTRRDDGNPPALRASFLPLRQVFA